jgi:putative component of membrane protein insertase Oxa1/YidC/SpoIIIJ protein YidD
MNSRNFQHFFRSVHKIVGTIHHIFVRMYHIFVSSIKNLLIFCVVGLRPLLGPKAACRFYTGCTQYAVEQLHTQPIHKALWRIVHRVLRCNPFY